MFTAWIAQVILSEVIGIPTVIETGKWTTGDFYDPSNPFVYASSGYNLPSMNLDRIDATGKCKSCTTAQLQADGSCACANAHTEVWEGQLAGLATGQASGDLTYGGSLGELVSVYRKGREGKGICDDSRTVSIFCPTLYASSPLLILFLLSH